MMNIIIISSEKRFPMIRYLVQNHSSHGAESGFELRSTCPGIHATSRTQDIRSQLWESGLVLAQAWFSAKSPPGELWKACPGSTPRHADFIGLGAAQTSVIFKNCPGDSVLRTTGLTPSCQAHFTQQTFPEIFFFFLHK